MKYLITSLLLMALTINVASAATDDFQAAADFTVNNVGGSGVTADMTIKSGSHAESWTLAAGILTVTNPHATNRFKLTSSNVGVASLKINDSGGTQVSCVTNSSPGTTDVWVPTAAGTYTIVPSSSACASTATAGTSGSGGGGGGTTPTPTPTPTPVLIPITTATGCLPGHLFSTVTGQKCTVTVPQAGCSGGAFSVTTGLACIGGAVATAATSPFVPTGLPGGLAAFVKTLAKGMTNSDVIKLQQVLNSDPDTQIAQSGVGAPGFETAYFGALTLKAVQKFQVKYGIAKAGEAGYGNVGPKTRAKLNMLIGR